MEINGAEGKYPLNLKEEAIKNKKDAIAVFKAIEGLIMNATRVKKIEAFLETLRLFAK